jgi:uncharacterized damage-inducible protein DinB
MATETQETISTMLITQWEQTNTKMITLAEHVSEDNYDYRPVAGVRTFADALRHTAFWSQCVAEKCHGREPDESANELPKTQYSTKRRILEALRQSNKDSVAALRKQAILDDATAEMLVTFIAHTSEHFGQLVVYTRLNGIVPPSAA